MTLWSLPPEEAQTTAVWNGIKFEFGRGWWVDSGVLKGGGRDGPKAGSHRGLPGSRPSKERAAAPWPQIGEPTFGPTLLMRDCIWRVFFDKLISVVCLVTTFDFRYAEAENKKYRILLGYLSLPAQPLLLIYEL